MIDLITGFLSFVLQINLKDPHETPFAMPLMIAAGIAFVNGFILLYWVEKDRKEQLRNAVAEPANRNGSGEES
ncbi:MAG: hypothetical protein ACU837_03250 [Gammaproteobacteria bacterium]